MSDETFRIKALEWEVEDDETFTVPTLFGPLAVCKSNVRGKWNALRVSGGFFSQHDSADAAKSAAEQWYVAKLREALTPVDTAPLEAVVEAAKRLDAWLDGWCPTQCSCAASAAPLHEKLHAALKAYSKSKAALEQKVTT